MLFSRFLKLLNEQGNTSERDKYIELASQQEDSLLAVGANESKQQIKESEPYEAAIQYTFNIRKVRTRITPLPYLAC
ncbi:hypothetical protein O9929_22250 [Vibrio lentus]|nr:hypothetical protein [Vibrio lentus]